jgi:DNA-binding response OmpR family regulator
MENFKSLYLEDDKEMHLLVEKHLPQNLTCRMASNITEAKKFLDEENFNLILVDLILDNESGFDFINYINEKEFLFMPSILIITSSDDEEDEIKAHQSNIYEYVRKPIRPKVLKSQLQKYLNRFETGKNFRQFGPIKINEEKMEVKISSGDAEQSVLLTLKEYQLLFKLINDPGKTYTREQLLVEVWNASSDVQSRTIDMHVSALRRKLGNYGEAISSIRGVGYVFDMDKLMV